MEKQGLSFSVFLQKWKHYQDQTVVRPVSPLLSPTSVSTVTHSVKDTKTNTIHKCNQNMWELKCIGCHAQSWESVPTDTLYPDTHSCPSQPCHRAYKTAHTHLNTSIHYALHCYLVPLAQLIKTNWLKWESSQPCPRHDRWHVSLLSMPLILFTK